MNAEGYIYTDIGRNAIMGAGWTSDGAWSQVVDGVNYFYEADPDSPGDERGITPEQARTEQYREVRATARLVALVQRSGGNVAWEEIGGIADVEMDEEVREVAEALEEAHAQWERETAPRPEDPVELVYRRGGVVSLANRKPTWPERLEIRRVAGRWEAKFLKNGHLGFRDALLFASGEPTEVAFSRIASGRSHVVAAGIPELFAAWKGEDDGNG